MKTLLVTAILVLVVAVLILVYFYRNATRQFGALPAGERLKRVEASPQYDPVARKFRNEEDTDFQANIPIFAMLREYVTGDQIRTPSVPLPSVHPEVRNFIAHAKDAPTRRLIWLGHSCVLLNIDGTILLLDPTLTARVSPVSLFGGRFQPPPLKLEELPPIDYIVISHDHYDHLDADSIRFFSLSSNRRSHIITPLGVGARLESFGVDPARITELDWWESFEDKGFKFTATPSQHFSGRGLADAAKTLWAGFAIQHREFNLFFSGDSGYHTHFKAIGKRLGPFDFSILESGQYNLWWRYVHMLPEEVAQAARLKIRTPILGEIIGVKGDDVQEPPARNRWWETHPDFLKRRSASEPN